MLLILSFFYDSVGLTLIFAVATAKNVKNILIFFEFGISEYETQNST